MTESSDSTQELSINEIVLAAYHMAGLLNYSQGLDTKRGQVGRKVLDTIIQHLEAQSIQVRRVAFYNLQLAAGTYQYTLPTQVLDVFGAGALVPATATDVNQADGETQVTPMTRDEWQSLSSHAAVGLPARYYVHRAASTVQVWLWPVPSDTGTVRLQTQQLAPSQANGNNTPGLELPWAQFFIWELAHQLAFMNNRSMDRVRHLQAGAAEKLAICKGFSNQRPAMQAVLDHNCGYNGGYR